MGKQDFFEKMKAYAMTASSQTGIPYEVILAQWALESNYGSSDLAKRANNFAGIKYTSNADFKSGAYAGYHSISNFVKDYVRIMKLPYYKKVREAGNVKDALLALGDSPYAEDPQYPYKLMRVIQDNDMGKIEALPISETGIDLGSAAKTLFSPLGILGLALLIIFKK
jgi:flagellum-specific peptidoglycan hydrolase FlgJ